jgi:hypothetical protein
MERGRGTAERQGAAFVMALRPWEYSGFVELRRRRNGNDHTNSHGPVEC